MVEENRNWSARVTRESDALDLEEDVFTWKDPRRIALSLQRSAEASRRRKSPPFRSAVECAIRQQCGQPRYSADHRRCHWSRYR